MKRRELFTRLIGAVVGSKLAAKLPWAPTAPMSAPPEIAGFVIGPLTINGVPVTYSRFAPGQSLYYIRANDSDLVQVYTGREWRS